MPGVLVYHNGVCSKCQGLTDLLREKNITVTYKFYLHEPMTVEELEALGNKLQLNARFLIRDTEPLYLEHYAGKRLTDTQC